MKSIDSIMQDMEDRIKENTPVSPAMWVDAAIKLNALKGDLDNDIAMFESNLAELECNYIKDGKAQSTAKALARGEDKEEYMEYLKAKAKSARIIEFIRLAKKRATIEEF